MLNSLIVIQPIDLCNLNCSYCYVPGRRNPKVMSDAVLDSCARVIFNSSVTASDNPKDAIRISWHAGEPMTVGIKFYERAIQYLRKYGHDSPFIMNIQTNGTLINQEWCDFFRENQFEVTVSIDGPEHIHDYCRKDWKGRGSFYKVIKGIDLLRKNNLPLRALSVLTDYSLDYPDEIYAFFKEHEFSYVGFNAEEQEAYNQHSSFGSYKSPNTKQLSLRFKTFMSRIFDLWEADRRPFELREFNELIDIIVRFKASDFNEGILNSPSIAFSIITISKDGDITTFSPEMAGGTAENPKKFVIGNVSEIQSFDELEKNDNFLHQRDAIFQGIRNCAKECHYFSLCGGGCPANKFYENSNFESTKTMACILTKQIISDVVIEKLEERS